MGIPSEVELENYAKHHNLDPEIVKEEVKSSDELANKVIEEERSEKKENA